jgi:hypothetical protein
MAAFSLSGLLGGAKNAEQIAEQKRIVEQRRIETQRRQAVADFQRLLKKEADYYQRRVVGTLGRIGFYYVSARKSTVQTVVITRAISTPEAHYFRVDTGRLPNGTYIDDMQADKTLSNLAASCERHVSVVFDGGRPECGFWYVVERGGAVRGIPAQVNYEDAYTAIPKSAGPLAFVVGVGVNKKRTVTDLAKAPHILVAGSTSMGKSTFCNNIICTIARRNSPDRVQFYMVDLKGGVELAAYESLPHLARPIITDPTETLSVLDDLLAEVQRRMELIKGKARNLDSFNRWKRAEYVPHLVLVVDELALLLLDKERHNKRTISYWAENKLARLAATSRAAGIHIVAATQRPSVDVITGLIKANFPVRVGFACADNAQSHTILDNAMAANLNRPGRLIFHKGSKYVELQCPFVSEELAEEIAGAVAAGDGEQEAPGDVPRSVVYQLCMEHFSKDGQHYMPQKQLWPLVKELGYTISAERFRLMLQEIEAEGRFTFEGASYQVHPQAGSSPRYFVACDMPHEENSQGYARPHEDDEEKTDHDDFEQSELAEHQDPHNQELQSNDVPF